jgi:hypothetical protein
MGHMNPRNISPQPPGWQPEIWMTGVEARNICLRLRRDQVTPNLGYAKPRMGTNIHPLALREFREDGDVLNCHDGRHESCRPWLDVTATWSKQTSSSSEQGRPVSPSPLRLTTTR